MTAKFTSPVLLSSVLSVLLSGCSFEWVMNKVDPGRDRPASARAVEVHQKAFVVDLHSDTLLWNRDLTERADYAHEDVPRMREGGIDLQIYSMPTQTPWGLNIESNDSHSDMLHVATPIKGWPLRTWFSTFERARYMAAKLAGVCAQPTQKVRCIRTKEDMAAALADPQTVNVMLSVEGAHAFRSLEELRVLHGDGLRMVGLTHFFDNKVGGSAHGRKKGRITRYGLEVVAEAERLGIVIDLAHASQPLIDDVLTVAKKPVVFSHTGVKGVCDNSRNISDDTLRRVAANGGVVGVAFFKPALCEATLEQVVAAILHVVKVAGVKHAALGSDWDGAVTTIFDATGLDRVTEELLAAGLSEDDVAAILGGNVVRVLREALPSAAQAQAMLR
jgi:microsomal dipeptidase-like Zn-dependent dipeptidase